MVLGETWLNQNTGLNCEIDGFECEHVYANKSIITKKGDTVAESHCTINLILKII